MGRTVGDLVPTDPEPEEVALAQYLLAYSRLEQTVRQLAVWAIALHHLYDNRNHNLDVARMVDALVSQMNFSSLCDAVSGIIDVRTASGEAARQWNKLRARCDEERRFRNRLVHSSISLGEADLQQELPPALLISPPGQAALPMDYVRYPESELQRRIENIDSLAAEIRAFRPSTR